MGDHLSYRELMAFSGPTQIGTLGYINLFKRVACSRMEGKAFVTKNLSRYTVTLNL
jgi:hypothetical protein